MVLMALKQAPPIVIASRLGVFKNWREAPLLNEKSPNVTLFKLFNSTINNHHHTYHMHRSEYYSYSTLYPSQWFLNKANLFINNLQYTNLSNRYQYIKRTLSFPIPNPLNHALLHPMWTKILPQSCNLQSLYLLGQDNLFHKQLIELLLTVNWVPDEYTLFLIRRFFISQQSTIKYNISIIPINSRHLLLSESFVKNEAESK